MPAHSGAEVAHWWRIHPSRGIRHQTSSFLTFPAAATDPFLLPLATAMGRTAPLLIPLPEAADVCMMMPLFSAGRAMRERENTLCRETERKDSLDDVLGCSLRMFSLQAESLSN
jgi:hypothetical protein